MLYHSGELAVQARVGVQAEADRLGKSIGGSIIQPTAQEFLRHQRLAIAASCAAFGAITSTVKTSGIWASLLTGEPGFVQAVDERTVWVKTTPIKDDLLSENLLATDEIGLLVIDLATRRRLRVNGKAKVQPDGIYVHTKQVYFNCPKYIQVRHLETESTLRQNHQIQRNETLTCSQQQWIAQTDTFFIASCHPESGADASHRGGNPGFVKVLNNSKLLFPDYSGNNMFNTLGNLVINPNAGLLFIDFERGNTLQLTGKATIIWDAKRTVEFAGAERLIEYQIEQVLEMTNASPLRWSFGEYSPFNPV
ncbi:pyridoxamine 5-phosphate oxidase [Tolypothrix campylonemoides VB511288]|nr:pyridoxamine 5-phosphate oxidase [Tolypothrix campylonemoides VB511288]